MKLPEIINGIFYVLPEGCSWRGLPHDLPPWQTGYNYYRHWQRLGIWQKIHTQLRHQVRKHNEVSLQVLDESTLKVLPLIDAKSHWTSVDQWQFKVVKSSG